MTNSSKRNKRRNLTLALALAVATLAVSWGGVGLNAQTRELPVPALGCAPVGVRPGNVVQLNVGSSNRQSLGPAALLLRILDGRGEPLKEQRIRLGPGESKRLRLRLQNTPARSLVRGEVIRIAAPEAFRLRGTLQVQNPGLGLTLGPIVSCTIPNRGPV